MGNKKLFQKKPDDQKMGAPILLRLTSSDKEAIQRSAALRKMTVSEYIRRTALGRRADVDIETDIILALSDSVRAVRDLHAAMLQLGLLPPEDILIQVINGAVEAMHRIEGKAVVIG